MVTVEKARKVLKSKYKLTYNKIIVSEKTFLKSFYCYHKLLSRSQNLNHVGYDNETRKYLNELKKDNTPYLGLCAEFKPVPIEEIMQ